MSQKSATEWLEKFIAQGYLKPRTEYWENILKFGDTWYTKMVANEGKEAADAALEEWFRARKIREFAASVESIGRAMLALSKVTEVAAEAIVFAPTREGAYPSTYSYTCEQVVILENANPGGCGCSDQPADVWEFYSGSVLGISHFGLQAGPDGAQLGLVFARPSRAQSESSKAEYKIITINTKGDISGQYYSAELQHNLLLYCNLGQIPPSRLINCSIGSGGSLDEHFQIPRMTDYLAGALPRLAVYLEQLAAKLSTSRDGHSH